MNKKIKTVITILTVFTLTTLFVLSGCNKNDAPESENNSESYKLHNTVAAASENFSTNAAEMNYYLNYGYASFLNTYGAYASYMGLDINGNLKEQECQVQQSQDGEKYTWYDFFMDQARSNVEQLLLLQEEAKARGITLSDEDEKEIQASLDELREGASKNGMSTEDFIKSSYGEYITEDDLVSCARMQSLASKAYQAIYDEPKYTSNDYNKYCSENMGEFYKCDYKSYSFTADYAEGASEAEIAKAQAKALESATALASVSDEAAFDAYVKAYLESEYTIVADSTETDEDNKNENTMTESKLAQAVSSTLHSGEAYSEETDFGKWAFEKNGEDYIRKVGDKTCITSEDGNTCTAYYLLKTVYRDGSVTKNVRHILIPLDTSDEEMGLPDSEAKAKAEALLNEFNAGDKKEASFAALAKENTTDPGSKENGGLYENVKNGDMVTEFNNWIFDLSRKAGDTDIVKTDYGYHVMYFVGDGLLTWEADADTSMRNKNANDAYTELLSKYPINFTEDIISTLEIISFAEETEGGEETNGSETQTDGSDTTNGSNSQTDGNAE